jgi:hypothetical protein
MTPTASRRGHASVISIAVLLAVAVFSMGTLTAAIGMLVDSNAAEADAERVASDFESTLEPVTVTGRQRGTVTFSEGAIRPIDRTLEVRTDGTVAKRIDIDGFVFESEDRRVAFHAGAIIRGDQGAARMGSPPPITVDEKLRIIGIARIGADPGSATGSDGTTAVVETDVVHDRYELGETAVTLAIETATPNVWVRYFEGFNATAERIPGDPPTVVVAFEGDRTSYLVVHDLNAEVRAGE